MVMYNDSMANRITIEYKGKKYHRYPDSKRRQLRVYYWRHDKWKGAPVPLHRQIYIDNFGAIPDGYHIHHKDGNTENNSPSNLQALPRFEHLSYEAKLRWGGEEGKKARAEERERVRLANLYKTATCKICGDQFQTKAPLSRVKYCQQCKDNMYSDKNGRFLKNDYQIKRFGRIVLPYIVK